MYKFTMGYNLKTAGFKVVFLRAVMNLEKKTIPFVSLLPRHFCLAILLIPVDGHVIFQLSS